MIFVPSEILGAGNPEPEPERKKADPTQPVGAPPPPPAEPASEGESARSARESGAPDEAPESHEEERAAVREADVVELEPLPEEQPARGPEILVRAPRPRCVIAAGLRLPQVKAGGLFRKENAAHLGAVAARELIARTGLAPEELDEVVVGCVGPPQDQANVGRVLALRAGVPQRVPARTIGRNCGSGLDAVTTACTSIEAGRGDLFLCVGVEVMSQYPLTYGEPMTALFERLSRAKTLGQRLSAMASFRPSFLKPRIALMDGLTDPVSGLIMGRTAELLARDFGITREAADRYACDSHLRAARARDSGRMAREVVPHLPLGAGPNDTAVLHDDGIRDGQTIEGLAKLRPYFEKPDGIVTVGNSCGISDGATALLVTTPERAHALGLTPLASVRAWAWAGLDPARMGLGPVFSSALALDQAGATLADMRAIELNEAFAAQVLACQKAFASDAFAREHLGRGERLGELDPELLNKNGGAIALGHPVGASGARLVLTTAIELGLVDGELGLATMCIGGGQGGAMVLERSSR